MADKIRLATEGAQDEIAAQINALANAVSGNGSANVSGNFASKNLMTENGARNAANAIANLTSATSAKLADVVLNNAAQTIAGQKTFTQDIVGNLSGTATTATQLSSSAGSAYIPVYFTGGKPSAVSNIYAGSNVRLGGSATASGSCSIAIGRAATASSACAVAVGNAASASATNAIAIGKATASETNSIAIGAGATASYACSIAIGNGASTTAAGQVALGTATVGGTAQPVYLSSGRVTALSGSVGSATQPVYLLSGAITASNATAGSGTKLMYMSSGVFTNSTSNIGSNASPVYLANGVITNCSLGRTTEKSSTTIYYNSRTALPNSWSSRTACYTKIKLGVNCCLYAITMNNSTAYFGTDTWIHSRLSSNAYAAWAESAAPASGLSYTDVGTCGGLILNTYTPANTNLNAFRCRGNAGYPFWVVDSGLLEPGSTFYFLAND